MNLQGGETLDTIVYPDLRIIQPARGYRFSLDPLLLCSLLEGSPRGPVIDLGCGSGVLALLLARRWPGLGILGLEIQARLADRAARGVLLNGFSDRVSIVRGDLRRCHRFLRAGCAGTVVANPPYRKRGSGRLPSDPERAAARHEILMSLADLLRAIDHLISPAGDFLMTWKPERFPELRAALLESGLRLLRVRPVLSRCGDNPFLLLCHGARPHRSPSEPEVMPPLIIFEDRSYTTEASALLNRGTPCDRLSFPSVIPKITYYAPRL